MDNQRHWIRYDTIKLIIAIILLILLIVLLLQWGGPGSNTPAVNPVAATATGPARSEQPTASPTLASTATALPTQAPPSPSATATLLPSPKPSLAPTATAQPTQAPTATPQATLAPTATPRPTLAPTATPLPIPQASAAQPAVSVVGLEPGRMVRLQFTNLPANVNFAVKMGASGSGAVGGSTMAHISSPDGGPVVVWVEILSELTGSPRLDVRMDNGSGVSATTSFDNLSSFTAPTTPAAGPSATPMIAVIRSMKIVRVEKGGIVVAELSNLPANAVFRVTLGKAGTQGIGGNEVAHLNSSSTAGLSAFGIFEIPIPLRNEATIDLRLESSGVVYVANFQNINY